MSSPPSEPSPLENATAPAAPSERLAELSGAGAERMRERWAWGLLAATVVLSALAFSWRGRPPRPGTTVVRSFSFVSADARGLECAGGGEPLENACGAKGPERAVPAVTTQGVLYVLEGLFADEAVKQLIEKHRRDKARFVVSCRGVLVERVPSLKVRFQTKSDFTDAQNVWHMKLESCTAR